MSVELAVHRGPEVPGNRPAPVHWPRRGERPAAPPLPAPRNARSADLPALLRLIQPLGENGVLLPRKRQQVQLSIGDFFVIERELDIVCCAALHIHCQGRLGEIACVATCSHHRRQGYGGLLLRHVEQQARAAGLEQVFVRSAHAADWFVRCGFREERPAVLPPQSTAAPPGRNSRLLHKRLH